MNAIESLIASGLLIKWVLFLVVVEGFLLMLFWRMTGKGIAPLALLFNLGAGGSLMLALHAVLTQQSHSVVAIWLISSLLFHVCDMAYRWVRQ